MSMFNGAEFRTLINGEPIKGERKTSFEVDDIRVVIYIPSIDDMFKYWNDRKGEHVNLKITNTNFDVDVTLEKVILIFENDEVVCIELRFV